MNKFDVEKASQRLALDTIRRYLARHPSGEPGGGHQLMLVFGTGVLEMNCSSAGEFELPDDASELGNQLLDWLVGVGVGAIALPIMYFVDRLLGGREAVDFALNRHPGWKTKDVPQDEHLVGLEKPIGYTAICPEKLWDALMELQKATCILVPPLGAALVADEPREA